jgi:hypothetical protein
MTMTNLNNILKEFSLKNFPIIRGLDRTGNEVFYTGRAGSAFVSTDKMEAFTGYSIEGARRKATQLNEATCLHGIRFVAISPEVQQAA